MNHNLIKRSIRTIVTTVIYLVMILPDGKMYAQDNKPLRLYMNLQCFQKEAEKELKTTVRARIGENNRILPVADLQINFYNETDSTEVLLGTAVSDQDGVAALTVQDGTSLYWSEEEGYRFTSSFDGSEQFRKGSTEVSVREARIDLGFSEIDTVKVITAEAFELNPVSGDKIPLEEVNVQFYSPGSFSLYRFGEAELQEGTCMVDFPVTLPGDAEGNLTIIARIEENDDYGFVEASSSKDWGAVRGPVVVEERRGLGDTDAPLWMVYTLIVLLSAVWIHYMYVFVVIYLIRKDGKAVR